MITPPVMTQTMITQRCHLSPARAAAALARTVLTGQVSLATEHSGPLGALARADDTMTRWGIQLGAVVAALGAALLLFLFGHPLLAGLALIAAVPAWTLAGKFVGAFDRAAASLIGQTDAQLTRRGETKLREAIESGRTTMPVGDLQAELEGNRLRVLHDRGELVIDDVEHAWSELDGDHLVLSAARPRGRADYDDVVVLSADGAVGRALGCPPPLP